MYNLHMTTKIREKTNKTEIQKLQTKAAILDELLVFIEDKYLGYLMGETEKENNIQLQKAKKILH